jgi:hypothetical protein
MDLACKEYIQLSQAVLKAVERVYSANAELDRTRKESRDIGPSATLLANARIEQRRAVAALDKREKEHGCLSAS